MANKYLRKGLSILLTLTMLVSVLQISALAAGADYGDGTVENPYRIGATVKGDMNEPAGETVEHSKWESTPVGATYEEEASCEIEEHPAHGETCYQQICEIEEHICSELGAVDGCQELICSAEEHTHSEQETEEGCYTLSCGEEIHAHSELGAGCRPQTCRRQEHTHSNRCGRDCRQWEHTHGENCYAACTIEIHSHEDGCYTLNCEIEEHTHSAEELCYEVCELAHTHSEWEAEDGCYELICEVELHEHSIEGGCFAVAEEAHILWTLVEQTYSATITVQLNGSSVSNANVVLKDEDGNTVATGTTARHGQGYGSARYVTLTGIPAGTYTVSASYSNDSNAYKGSEELTVSGPNAVATIDLQRAYGDVEAMVYYIYSNQVPGEINGPFNEVGFGPSGDNTPLVTVTVDLDELLANTGMTMWTRPNTNNIYLSVDNDSKDRYTDDMTGVKALWAEILKAMDADDKEELEAKVGENQFIGYVLKREGAEWHIDGVLAQDPPVYVVEIYHNAEPVKVLSKGLEKVDNTMAIRYSTPAERGDTTVKEAIEEYLGTGGSWSSDGATFDNIYTYTDDEGLQYQATIEAIKNTKVPQGDVIHYNAVTQNVYYVAYFNIKEIKDITEYQNYEVVANYYTEGSETPDNASPVEIATVNQVTSLPSTAVIEDRYSEDHTEYNGKTYDYTSIEQEGNTFILRYDYVEPYTPSHTLGSITVTKSTSGAETPGTATFQLQKQNGEGWMNIGEAVVYAAFTDGSYTFENLEEGVYQIVEDGADVVAGYDLEVTKGTVELVKESTGYKDDTAVSSGTINITNAYTQQTGSLKITKASNRTDLIPGATVFTVTGPNSYSEEILYSEFTDRAYIIHDLPVGEYTVTENAVSAQVTGYHLDAPGAETAEVIKGETAAVTIINNYTLLPPTSVSGQFNLGFDKAVTGDEYTMNGNDFVFALADGTNTYTGYNDADGHVTIEVPFHVDLASETGTSATRTLTYTLSEQAGSVEGMTYDSTEYEISVKINFTRSSSLHTWSWSVAEVSGAAASISNANVALSAAEGAPLFTNEYDRPVYTGSITLIKEIKGDLTEEEKVALESKLDFVVNKVFIPYGGGNAYIKYTSMTDGKWIMASEQPGTYTITENDAEMEGYKLTTEWKVEGAANQSESSAQFALEAGDEVTVTITNTYEEVPTYEYKVVHEYFYSENGGGYVSQGTSAGSTHTVAQGENTPTPKAVFDAQVVSEEYQDYSYARLSEYVDGEVTREGVLREGTLVFTVKYYRSDWTEGSLTIRKTINGLDEITLASLKKNLTFTVTGENGFEEVISFKDFDHDERYASYTLSELVPGTYTIAENGAEIEGSGYELTVEASDADDEMEGYQVKVRAGETATRFAITNSYSSRVYNIWFDGGSYGTVQLAGDNTEGVWRNRWQLFQLGQDEPYYNWGGLLLNPGKMIYQNSNGSANIYDGLNENPVIADGTAQVLYTFSWSQWADNQETMGISKPGLKIDTGYTSDREFYIPGTDIAFTSIEEAMAYMNSGAVEPDANGFYNVLYVARYEKTVPQKEYGNIYLAKSFSKDHVELTSAPAGFNGSFQLQKLEEGAWTTIQTIAWSEFDEYGGYAIEEIETGTYRIVEIGGGIADHNWSYKVTYYENGGVSNDSVIVDAEEGVEVIIENSYSKIPVEVPDGPGPGGDDDDDDEPIEIIDEEPPLSDLPEEEPLEEILEEEVPLANVPKTGDAMMLYSVLSALSGMGLIGLGLTGRKRKENEIE